MTPLLKEILPHDGGVTVWQGLVATVADIEQIQLGMSLVKSLDLMKARASR